MGLVKVRGLERWQHYKKRNPPWIKLYNSIFNDYQFSILSDCQKFHLIAIWSLASVMENKLPDDPGWIANRIGANSSFSIDELVKHGFLERVNDDSNTTQ